MALGVIEYGDARVGKLVEISLIIESLSAQPERWRQFLSANHEQRMRLCFGQKKQGVRRVPSERAIVRVQPAVLAEIIGRHDRTGFPFRASRLREFIFMK